MQMIQFDDTKYDRVLDWKADNRWFVIDILLPSLNLRGYDKKVMRWAYDHDTGIENMTFEQLCDGETLVKDKFLDGIIKSPAGVGHDYLNRTPNHQTPDGHIWTPWQANALYLRILKSLGYGFRARWRRWLGVTISSNYWWK